MARNRLSLFTKSTACVCDQHGGENQASIRGRKRKVEYWRIEVKLLFLPPILFLDFPAI
jgi:hypothetical protein